MRNKPEPEDTRPRCPLCQQVLKSPGSYSALQSMRSRKRLNPAGKPRACECNKDDCKTCAAYWKRRNKIDAAKKAELHLGL